MSKRRTHSPEFKARVAMEAISGRKTIQEIAVDHTSTFQPETPPNPKEPLANRPGVLPSSRWQCPRA